MAQFQHGTDSVHQKVTKNELQLLSAFLKKHSSSHTSISRNPALQCLIISLRHVCSKVTQTLNSHTIFSQLQSAGTFPTFFCHLYLEFIFLDAFYPPLLTLWTSFLPPSILLVLYHKRYWNDAPKHLALVEGIGSTVRGEGETVTTQAIIHPILLHQIKGRIPNSPDKLP